MFTPLISSLIKINVNVYLTIKQAFLVIFAIVLITAAPAHDETIVNDVAQDEGVLVVSPNEDPNSILKLLLLKKLLLLGWKRKFAMNQQLR